jgi:hypothetical protein
MPVTGAKCRQASPGIALIPFEFGRLSERRANVCFGGLKRNRLFIAASQSLYALYVNTQGASGRLDLLPRGLPRDLRRHVGAVRGPARIPDDLSCPYVLPRNRCVYDTCG